MNQIRSSITMAWKDLKIVFKDRGQLAVLFALPLLFALLFGGASALMAGDGGPGGESKLVIRVYLVNEDEGPYGEQVEAALRGIRPLRILQARNADTADQLVADGRAPAAVIIPDDFSARLDENQATAVRLIKDPAQQNEARAVAGILNEALTELSVMAEVQYGIRSVFAKTGALAGAEPELARAVQAQTMGVIWTAVQEIRQNPAIAVRSEDLTGEVKELKVSSLIFAFYVPMFATMFAFFLIGHMAASILSEREAGSFRRLLAAPVPRATVISGKMLSFMGVVFLQMLLMFGVGSVLFDMPLGESPWGLLALTLALALAATGLGMLVGTVARNSKEAGNVGMVVGFLLYFASGQTGGSISRTGYESGLEGFRYYLSQLTPHAHAFDGYLKVVLGGAGVADILPNILALLGFGVFFFLIGLWRFKYE